MRLKGFCSFAFAAWLFAILSQNRFGPASEIYSEAAIPTTDALSAAEESDSVLNECCNHLDCVEARVIILKWIDKDHVLIQINNFKPFIAPKHKIHPSKDGKTYYCHMPVESPPTPENFRCAFITTIPYAIFNPFVSGRA